MRHLIAHSFNLSRSVVLAERTIGPLSTKLMILVMFCQEFLLRFNYSHVCCDTEITIFGSKFYKDACPARRLRRALWVTVAYTPLPSNDTSRIFDKTASGGIQVSDWIALQPGEHTCAVLTSDSTIGLYAEKGPEEFYANRTTAKFLKSDLNRTSFRPYNPSVVTRAILC